MHGVHISCTYPANINCAHILQTSHRAHKAVRAGIEKCCRGVCAHCGRGATLCCAESRGGILLQATRVLQSSRPAQLQCFIHINTWNTLVKVCCCMLLLLQGEPRADVLTLATASRLDNIRAVFGALLAKELLPLSVQVRLRATCAQCITVQYLKISATQVSALSMPSAICLC